MRNKLVGGVNVKETNISEKIKATLTVLDTLGDNSDYINIVGGCRRTSSWTGRWTLGWRSEFLDWALYSWLEE